MNKRKMKKILMTMMAALLVSSTAVAHGKKECRCQDGKPDKQEMVKHRTDETVKRYNLNDKQAKQLLELNTKYADKMGQRGPRHPGHHGGPGRPPKDGKDMKGQRPEPPKDGERPEPPKDDKRMERHQEMEATMKAYDAELQKIMTTDQFKSYQADRKADREKHHKEKK